MRGERTHFAQPSIDSLHRPVDQIPYCATSRSRSGSGNCSEKRRQFSSPTWFLKPCKICTKVKIMVIHRILILHFLIKFVWNVPCKTFLWDRPWDWPRKQRHHRKRWSLERLQVGCARSFCKHLETQSPSLRCHEYCEETCTCNSNIPTWHHESIQSETVGFLHKKLKAYHWRMKRCRRGATCAGHTRPSRPIVIAAKKRVHVSIRSISMELGKTQ